MSLATLHQILWINVLSFSSSALNALRARRAVCNQVEVGHRWDVSAKRIIPVGVYLELPRAEVTSRMEKLCEHVPIGIKTPLTNDKLSPSRKCGAQAFQARETGEHLEREGVLGGILVVALQDGRACPVLHTQPLVNGLIDEDYVLPVCESWAQLVQKDRLTSADVALDSDNTRSGAHYAGERWEKPEINFGGSRN